MSLRRCLPYAHAVLPTVVAIACSIVKSLNVLKGCEPSGHATSGPTARWSTRALEPPNLGGGVTNFQPHEAQKLSCGGKLIFDEIVLFHRVVAPNRLEKKVDHTKWTTLSGPISSANTYL